MRAYRIGGLRRLRFPAFQPDPSLRASSVLLQNLAVGRAAIRIRWHGAPARPAALDDGLIHHLDHLVLTTTNEAGCVDFYTRVLGMRLEKFVGGSPPVERRAFCFGNQKINLHVKGREFEPKAHLPVPGALDLCFIANCPLESVIEHLRLAPWPIVEGPVKRTGATGKIRSVYVRDPDLNLIEISEIDLVTCSSSALTEHAR